jgi:large subunit ribosomal protein L25
MEKRTLNARPRSVVGKQAKALRRQGRIPAVLYGRGAEPQNLEIDMREANRVLTHVSGSTLIELAVDGAAHQVLVREIQRDPIRRDLIHIDFLQVAMDVAITAAVPLEIVGEAPAVKTFAGVIVTGLDEIEVEALPADLPDRISVDLGSLEEIGQAIVVGDLFVGKGVKLLTSPSEMVVRVMSQAAEEVEEVEVVAEAGEPEVIERRKEEGEEGEDGDKDKDTEKEK